MLSLVLLVLFSSSLIAPIFASDGSSNLPACCRRAGAHHCSGMTPSLTDGSGPTLTAVHARCPLYPHATRGFELRQGSLTRSESCCAELVAHQSGRAQTEARYRSSSVRARHKRGPPARPPRLSK